MSSSCGAAPAATAASTEGPSHREPENSGLGATFLGLAGDFDRDSVADYAVLLGEPLPDGGWNCFASFRSGRSDVELHRFALGELPRLAWTDLCADLNGDGIAEVATNWRELRIYSGADGGLLLHRAGAGFVGSPGDFDGDSLREIVIGVRADRRDALRYELIGLSTQQLLAGPDMTDWALGLRCGDVDDDGFEDSVVRLADGTLGVLSGRSGELQWRLDASGFEALHFAALAPSDVAFPRDVFLGGCGSPPSWAKSGRSEVRRIRAGVQSQRAEALLSRSLRDTTVPHNLPLAWVGDVDGDHQADVVLARTTCGPDSHLSGSALELFASAAAEPLWSTEARYSRHIAALADRDGDGIDEVVTSDLRGRIVVLSGRSGALLACYAPWPRDCRAVSRTDARFDRSSSMPSRTTTPSRY